MSTNFISSMKLFLFTRNPELSNHLMGILSSNWKTPVLITNYEFIKTIKNNQVSIFIITPDIDKREALETIRSNIQDNVIIEYNVKNSNSPIVLLSDGIDFSIHDDHIQGENIQFLIQAIRIKWENYELQRNNLKLNGYLKEWISIFQDSLDLNFIIDSGTRTIIEINHTTTIILGYTKDELIGTKLENIFKPEPGNQPLGSDFYGSSIVSQGLITKEGEWIPMESTWRMFENEGNTQILATFRDISERRKADAKIQQLVYFDPISNLPNRIFFLEKLKDSLHNSKTHNSKFAIVSIDMDNFILINETLGSDIGNRIIKSVGESINGFQEKKMFLGYFGGDNFGMLVEDIDNLEDAEHYINNFQNYLRNPILVDENEFYLTFTMGMSVFPSHGESSSELMKASVMALYKSKDKGRNSYTVFSKKMILEVEKRIEIKNDLRKALQNQEFKMVYQPIVSIHNLTICGMESLIRWNHPSNGVISPNIFIPIAELTGLMREIGEFVLFESCRTAKRWMDKGIIDFPVSVNISAKQWLSVHLFNEIANVIHNTGLPFSKLNLELTESVIMEDFDNSSYIFDNLINKGIGLSVDDFGTGYSSLSYLKKLKVHHLKIDRSFIIDLEFNESDRAIATAIIQLAHSVGLTVVAEGVETRGQYLILKSLGCDYIQGYFISPPLPEKEFEDFLYSYRILNHEVFAANFS